MHFQTKAIFVRLFSFLFLLTTTAFATERDQELRTEMWGSPDKNFKVLEIPKKWNNKSAVIIAQLNRFEYRKPPLVNVLKYNEYSHYRIKVLDKNAVNKYSEMTFLPSRQDNSTGESIKVYVGFKVIKPGGKEVIVDETKAVKMEREYRGYKQSYFKLAIPSLEPGDIIDYYICEETSKSNTSLIYFFNPVIYPLPQEYPVMNHKLQFRAARKCYINLRSLNGAPQLKLETDEANEEQYYSLDGTDIEGVEETKWLYQYREMPTIKFRAAFASGKGMRNFDVLLGEPGVVKNSVTKSELQDMAKTMLAIPYDVKFMTKYAKKNLKTEKDPFKIASEIYYLYRNESFNMSEGELIQGNSPWSSMNQIKFVDAFSTFLAAKKIQHDIVMAVPRHISALNDLLIENEIEWLVRVKKGNESMYFSAFDQVSTPGTIDVALEGTDAYVLDGMVSPSKWNAKTITLPVTTAEENKTDSEVKVDLTDLTKAKVIVRRSHLGQNKLSDQYNLLDTYDFKEEELKKFPNDDPYYGWIGKKKYIALEQAYLSKREENRQENLISSIERDFAIKVTDVADFKVEQTGRFHQNPAMVYSFSFKSEELVKKTGPNYLLDVGKLIESQTQIKAEEMERTNNVYFDNARSFKYRIVVDIPTGYEVQGLEQLNQKVTSKTGGFESSAKVEKGQLIIVTNKHYDTNYASKDEWKNIVKFLNAAHAFSEQKVLLKKK